METIYRGNYLKIKYFEEKQLFIQNWDLTPKDYDSFKLEMLNYTKLYEVYKPKHTLWLQENFSLTINDDLIDWIELNVNIPCFNYGNKKCAFVVAKDVLAHLQTIDAFDKKESCIVPRHFATKEEAMHWLDSNNDLKKDIKKTTIVCDGIDASGNVILKIPTQNIKEALKNAQKTVELDAFILENFQKTQLLTKREIEILKLIAKNKKQKEIADTLHISIHTLRKHWNNIKNKLDFESEIDLGVFAKFII